MGELKDRDRELNDMVAVHQRQLLSWEEDRQKVLTLEERCSKLEGQTRAQQHLAADTYGGAPPPRDDGGRDDGGGGGGGGRVSTSSVPALLESGSPEGRKPPPDTHPQWASQTDRQGVHYRRRDRVCFRRAPGGGPVPLGRGERILRNSGLSRNVDKDALD